MRDRLGRVIEEGAKVSFASDTFGKVSDGVVTDVSSLVTGQSRPGQAPLETITITMQVKFAAPSATRRCRRWSLSNRQPQTASRRANSRW